MIDRYFNLIHCFGFARQFLRQPGGASTLNLLNMLEEGLRAAIESAVPKIQDDKKSIKIPNVKVVYKNEEQFVTVTIEQFTGREQELFLISMSVSGETADSDKEHVSSELNRAGSQQMADLERELDYTRETLRATVEELEASNEELQSTNEELVASNEELQSTNEELHSVNEELYSVNAEHQRKIEELDQLADDTERLLGSANIGALFLNSDLEIQRFTKSLTTHFDLVPHDINRHLSTFRHRTGLANLVDITREVALSGSTFSKSLDDDLGNPILVKIARSTLGDGNPGVVINIVAQTAIVQQQFEQLYLPIGSGYWEWPNVKEDKMWWSGTCFELLGMPVESSVQTFTVWKDLVHPDDLIKLRQPGTTECEFVRNGFLAVRMRKTDGEFEKFCFRGVFQYDEQGNPISMSGSFAPASAETPADDISD